MPSDLLITGVGSATDITRRLAAEAADALARVNALSQPGSR